MHVPLAIAILLVHFTQCMQRKRLRCLRVLALRAFEWKPGFRFHRLLIHLVLMLSALRTHVFSPKMTYYVSTFKWDVYSILTQARFPLPVNTGCVDGRALSTSRVDGICKICKSSQHTATSYLYT